VQPRRRGAAPLAAPFSLPFLAWEKDGGGRGVCPPGVQNAPPPPLARPLPKKTKKPLFARFGFFSALWSLFGWPPPGALQSHTLFRPPTNPPSTVRPAALKDVGIDQKLNNRLPLDLHFRDETGREVRLGEFFGSKPVILTPVYYGCPMLCTQILNGLVGGLK